MGLHAAAIYKFIYYINLQLFFLICVCAQKYGNYKWNVQCNKKAYIFCLACAITAFENSDTIFYISVEQWWAKLVIQVLVEYQVPNFEMDISFELRLEYMSTMHNIGIARV